MATPQQQLVQRRRDAGLCIRCGKGPPESGKSFCENCRKHREANRDKIRQSQLHREKRRQRKEAGLCTGCGKCRARPGKTKCSDCATKLGKLREARLAKRRFAKICTHCGVNLIPLKDERRLCKSCRDAAKKEAERKYLELGLCKSCGKRKPKPGKVNCEICIKRRTQEKLRQTRKQRRLVIEHYGARCACCGESEYHFLTIDHKNNDGADHRRRLGRSPAKVVIEIIKQNFPDTYQVLCYNCNCAKGKLGYCPHQK